MYAFCTHAEHVHAAYVHRVQSCDLHICDWLGKSDNFVQFFKIELLAQHQPGAAEWALMNLVSISHGMRTQ